MKLIKKIAAIMFAFMMVFTLSSNVSAETTNFGSQADGTTGTLTITKAKPKQTYKLYKMLELESFSGKNYSYKIAPGWDEFFKDSKYEGSKYFTQNNDEYITLNNGVTDENLRELAKKALEFVNEKGIKVITTLTTGEDGSYTAENLPLGYYLLDSSVGALCSLTSSNPNVTIEEKNDVPYVDKKIQIDTKEANENSVSIGDNIDFSTTIYVKKGAQSYVLYDNMSEGLTLNDKVNQNHNHPVYVYTTLGTHTFLTDGNGFKFEKTSNGFKITFDENFLQSHQTEEYEIHVCYSATLNSKALISTKDKLQANTNETYLTYGDSKKSTSSTTKTYTFAFPVLKYTGSIDNPTRLSGAKFKLYSDSDCKTEIKLTKDGNNYRRLTGVETEAEIVTDATGEFTIQGLAEGTYYLKETKAPNGYNTLKDPITVKLDRVADGDGASSLSIKQYDKPTDRINVLNNSGTILPSTGGMGTTLIYLIGGALVLGSGFVLANKKRAKAK